MFASIINVCSVIWILDWILIDVFDFDFSCKHGGNLTIVQDSSFLPEDSVSFIYRFT